MFRGVVLEPGVIMLLLSTLPSSPRCDIVPFTGFDLNGCSLSLPDKKTREPLRSGGWSDRELQFKKFKLECNTLCKAASAAFNDYAASSNTNNPTSCLDLASEGLSHIATTLCTLSSDIGKSYRSFPLLCSRTPQRFNETSTEAVGESVTVTKDEE